MSLRLLAASVLLLCGLSSCVRLAWSRYEVNELIPEEQTADLKPGVDTLGTCLDRLGAPLYAWEVNASTYALAYGWNEGLDWGFNISVPISEGASASFEYGDVNLDLPGLVLVFDYDDRLVRSDRGFLRDIAPGLERRRRPAWLEEDDQES